MTAGVAGLAAKRGGGGWRDALVAPSQPVRGASADDAETRSALAPELESWRARLGVPRLSAFGIAPRDIPAIVADSLGSSTKTNPVTLTDDEIATILKASL